MQRTKKRILSTLLALVMVLGLLPATALAASKPVVTTQPSSKTAATGTTVTFKVVADDVDSYQWQYKTDTTDWKNSGATGNKTASLKVTAKSDFDDYQYRCKMTNEVGTTYSKAVTLNVVAPGTVTKSPSSTVVKIGKTATFKVTAVGAESYQWQYRTSSTGTWKNSGSTGNETATLSVGATVARDGYQFRCKVIGTDDSVHYSKAATLTVCGVTTQPADVSVGIGSKATFTVEAMGAASYQWQYKTPTSDWKNSGSTGNKTDTVSLTAKAVHDGYQFRCKIINTAGKYFYSDVAILTVMPAGTISGHPTDASVRIGKIATFNVAAEGAASYQWQYRTSSTGSWKNSGASGNKTANLDVTAKQSFDGYQYRCQVTFKDGVVLSSNAATLTVFGVTTQPTNKTVAEGESATFSLETYGEGLSYQWQYRTSSTGSWKTSGATGNKTTTLKVSGKADYNGYQYRCKITTSDKRYFYSNTVTLTVTSPFAFTKQPVGAMVAVDELIEMSVAVSGGTKPYSYQWQMSNETDSIYGYSDIEGATNAVYQANADESNMGHWFRCVVTDGSGNTYTSSAACAHAYIPVKFVDAPKSLSLGKLSETYRYEILTPYFEGGGYHLTYEWEWANGTIAEGNLTDSSFKPLSSLNTTAISNSTTDASLVFVAKDGSRDALETALTGSGLWFRCKATGERGNDTAVSAPIAVYAKDFAFVEKPADKEFSSNQTVHYAAVETEGGFGSSNSYTYEWYGNSKKITGSNSDGVFSGYNSSSLTINSGVFNTSKGWVNNQGIVYLKVVVTDCLGNSITHNFRIAQNGYGSYL